MLIQFSQTKFLRIPSRRCWSIWLPIADQKNSTAHKLCCSKIKDSIQSHLRLVGSIWPPSFDKKRPYQSLGYSLLLPYLMCKAGMPFTTKTRIDRFGTKAVFAPALDRLQSSKIQVGLRKFYSCPWAGMLRLQAATTGKAKEQSLWGHVVLTLADDSWFGYCRIEAKLRRSYQSPFPLLSPSPNQNRALGFSCFPLA